MGIQHNLDHSSGRPVSAQVAEEDVLDTFEMDIQIAREELVNAYDRALQKVIRALRASGNAGASGASDVSQVH